MSTVSYQCLYRLTPQGMRYLESIYHTRAIPDAEKYTDPSYALPLAESSAFNVEVFRTKAEMAEAVVSAFADLQVLDFIDDAELWSWITLVLLTQICPVDPNTNLLKQVEEHKVLPSKASDFRKAQRHLVRMPTLLFRQFGSDVDHLLCGAPDKLSDVFEQLTSQQDMFTESFQRVARTLYFDDSTGSVKRGAGGKGQGSARRLRAIRSQLDVTYDVVGRTADELLNLLPEEFIKFREEIPAESDVPATQQ